MSTLPRYRRTALEFFDAREMQAAMSVTTAAKRYGKSPRTIQRWCDEWPIAVQHGSGPHQISRPLIELRATGRTRELQDYFDGKPLSDSVISAFEQFNLAGALVDCEAKRETLAARNAAEKTKSAIAAIADTAA